MSKKRGFDIDFPEQTQDGSHTGARTSDARGVPGRRLRLHRQMRP